MFREAFRLLLNRKRLNLISLGAISLALMALGLLLVLQLGVFKLVEFVDEKVEVVAFLNDRLSDTETQTLLGKIHASSQVVGVEYHSKEDAIREFSGDPALKRFLDALGSNPLPASVRIQLREKTAENVAYFVAWLNEQEGVEESTYGGGDADRLLKFLQLVRLGCVILTAVLTVAAMFIIANIISLMVFARREEITIMRMIGATKWFVRGPFLIWGLVQGALGGVVAAGLMFGIWKVMSYYAWRDVSVDLEALLPPQIQSWALAALGGLIGAGALMGLISSLTAVGRQLRE
jgi:cell division transport system permease protein